MRDLSLSSTQQNILRIIGKVERLRAIQCALLALYMLALARLLPLDRLGAQPMLRADFSYHYSQIVELRDLIAEHGDAWGYSPRFFAGYPIGINSNLGAKGWTWFVYLLSALSVDTITAFNLFVVLWWALMPLLVYKAARWFELSPSTATLAVITATLYWWGSYPYRYIVEWGGISFMASAPFALFGLAAFAAYARHGRWRHLLIMTVVFALSGWLHLLASIVIAPGVALLYVLHFRRMRRLQHIALIIAGIAVVIAQWPWLGPFLEIGQWFVKSDHQLYLQAGGWDMLRSDVFSAQPPATLHRLLLAGWLGGLFVWRRVRQRAWLWFFAIIPATLFLLGYFGASMVELQPARFIPVAYLWLALPVAVAMQRLRDMLRRNEQRLSFSIIIIACAVMAAWPALALIAQRMRAQNLTLIEAARPDAIELIDWLQRHTTRGGRILFQDAEEHWQTNYNVTAGYIAYAAQRDLIGGPYPWGGPVDFLYDQPFGRDIETITPDQFAHYLDLYNIHWVVVYSQALRDALDAQPQLVTRVADLPIAQIYAVNDAGDYFLKGSGRVEVNGGRIELYDLQGDEVILKYHWTPQLTSAPSADISRFRVAPDPYGFIRIIHPPERLTLWVKP